MSSKQPALPETEPAAEEQAAKTINRRPMAEDLRLMHRIDGIFEELSGHLSDETMALVLVRLCSSYAPSGFVFSNMKSKEPSV